MTDLRIVPVEELDMEKIRGTFDRGFAGSHDIIVPIGNMGEEEGKLYVQTLTNRILGELNYIVLGCISDDRTEYALSVVGDNN